MAADLAHPTTPCGREAIEGALGHSRFAVGRIFGLMSGLDLYTVGRLLGHANVASTERYAHLADDHIREVAGRISGIAGEAMSGGWRREG